MVWYLRYLTTGIGTAGNDGSCCLQTTMPAVCLGLEGCTDCMLAAVPLEVAVWLDGMFRDKERWNGPRHSPAQLMKRLPALVPK
jgi:hypothetical protein